MLLLHSINPFKVTHMVYQYRQPKIFLSNNRPIKYRYYQSISLLLAKLLLLPFDSLALTHLTSQRPRVFVEGTSLTARIDMKGGLEFKGV